MNFENVIIGRINNRYKLKQLQKLLTIFLTENNTEDLGICIHFLLKHFHVL